MCHVILIWGVFNLVPLVRAQNVILEFVRVVEAKEHVAADSLRGKELTGIGG
jgi:hypothetical protein